MDEGRARVSFYNEAKPADKLHINILSKTGNYHQLLKRYVKFSLPSLFAQKKDPYGATLFFHLLPTVFMWSNKDHDSFILKALQKIRNG